ncbi:beta strand repeat-containing protein [Nostoc sp.]|uniref:beta strand repeat-containing protein n=1 Tax=Nostoc sp. TaxID=1180 RepID=UPI002FF99DB5
MRSHLSNSFSYPKRIATAGALNGNQSANRTVITPVIINLATPIANGEEIILRWEDIDDGGNDHGLAIDDVSVKVDGTTYIVTNTNDSGAGSLRQAIINANNDPGIETILFDTTGIFGDATPDTITLTSGELNVIEGVIIQGTGANKLTISGNNTSRVFNASASLSIDGLKITGGNAANGGGINSTSSVTVSNSTFSGNTASTSGGGIYSSSATVSNSTFSGNTASTGGGIYSSSATVSDSSIFSNIANLGGGIYSTNATVSNTTLFGNTANSNGGGIFSSGSNSSVTISNSTISSNTAKTNGGGIYSTNNTTVSNSTIFGNTSDSDNNGQGDGGGIYSTSSVTVSGSSISGNIANLGGGIYSTNVTVNNSTLSGNTANSNGGGIFSNTSVTISNSTISSNTAKTNGGGIYSRSNATVSNSTIFGNTATQGNGGGIYKSGGTATASVSNSIIAGNIDPGNQGADVFGNNFNGNAYNLIGKIVGKSSGTLGTGTDIINPNPGLKPLGNYGGSTQTHALYFNSPARNAGDPAYSGGLTTDQRGTDFNRIESERIDIGAFEYVLPKVSFGAATYNTTEDSTATTVTISVTLDASPETAVTVPIVVKSNSTATSGKDYTFSPTTISFTAGATGSNLTQLITFTINPDDLPENAETVVLNFGTLTGADLGTITETTLNIAANDSIQYAISTATSTLTEGNSGTQAVTFTVTRSGGIGVASTIDYAFSGAAIFGSDSDYNSASRTITFNPGETSKTLSIGVVGDNKFETDETFSVNLLAATNGTITDGLGVATIINDDNQPTITISDVSVTEGNTGTTTNANFTISLSNPSSQQVTVNYNTSDGTAQVADSDYNSASRTITFNPGETSKTLSIGVVGDNKFETDETFSVNLLGATNAAIADSLGVATIIDNDNPTTVSISDVSIAEGNTGTTTNANFIVTLSAPSLQQVTVNYNTSDGTAKVSNSDYNPASGTIIFNPGETTKTLGIAVIGDNKAENNETFSVNLFGATNTTITDSLGVATITNDDEPPAISIADVSVKEGTIGMITNANFVVTLSNEFYQRVIVNYSTSDGTAKESDSDYNFGLGTIILTLAKLAKLLVLASEVIIKLNPMKHFLSIFMVQQMPYLIRTKELAQSRMMTNCY